MYNIEELEKIINDPDLFLRAVCRAEEIAPAIKSVVIAKILSAYRVELQNAFGITR